MTNTFEALDIGTNYLEILKTNQITEPTEIQREAIPLITQGKDVIAQSQTGTGKTLAYLLPAMQGIDPNSKELQAIVLVPTRELGMQIIREIETLNAGNELIAQSLIGGAAISRQVEKLRLHPQIVVGTPGRILELIKIRKLKMHEVKKIVVDEVDQVFDLGSMNEVEDIFKSALRDRQIVFFSATIPQPIQIIADRWMRDPVKLEINPNQRTAELIEHQYFISDERDKIDTLRRILRLYNPKSAIVFINHIDNIAELVAKLKYVGLTVEALYGEAKKQERAIVLNGFREGKFQLLLATDVAARGLDIREVTHVINFDLPIDADHYVHRVGRTGRMGQSGLAISIVTPRETFIIDKFMKQLNISIVLKDMFKGKIVAPNKDVSKVSNRGQTANILKSNKSQNYSKMNREQDLKNKGAPKWLKDKGKE